MFMLCQFRWSEIIGFFFHILLSIHAPPHPRIMQFLDLNTECHFSQKHFVNEMKNVCPEFFSFCVKQFLARWILNEMFRKLILVVMYLHALSEVVYVWKFNF
jgi:predicted amidophosphoribosyltransferase